MRHREIQARILLEDPSLEVAQRWRRLDPELVGERAPGLLIRGERLCLPPRPVEREHLLPAQTFPEGVTRDQRFELPADLTVTP
ncbi:MAG TPA: hypothetical protein VFN92_08060, partial [Solirubrobacterales bacterium]|nr:hypothetical protein [Solirubrobacterales bacterium]